MSGPQSSMPSWQSMQRIPGGGGSSTGGQSYPSSHSPPPSSFRGYPHGPGSSGGASSEFGQTQQQQQQQQQAFPGSQARFRPSTGGGASSSSGSGPGRPVDRSNSFVGFPNGASSPARQDSGPGRQQPWPQQQGGAEQQQQQPGVPPSQSHRRTQSLRPMSAFQPLENVDGPYAGGGPRPPSPTGSTSRSIRTAAAPLTFKSPELRSALSLQEAQSKKIYMEGYLSKRDHLAPDGKPLPPTDQKKRWQLCFVQLSGTVLSVWNVHQMEEAARQGTEVPPSYINVTDCFVDFIGTITESPQDVPGSRGRYENVFAINTAGQNRILFGVEGSVGRRLVQAWVNGIRLATWEKLRLEEIYTGSLVRARLGAVSAQQATSGPGGAPGDIEMSIKSPLGKNGRMEGWVKARFMGSTEWRKCWLVLTDRGAESAAGTGGKDEQQSETSSVTSPRNSFWSKLRAGDRSSLIGSPSMPALSDTGVKDMEPPPGSNGAPGLACFYETKKTKKPFATMAYAAHAFAVYPSRPELVEGSSLFKVEGAFPLSGVVSATNRIRQSGWVMIMPELDSGSSKGANAEMMKWCIAFMDAFRLYGRPTQFQWDARNPVSPFFAYPIGPYKDRLFLDRELSEFLDIREERHLANRNNLHGIMSARMRGERTPILPPLPQPNVESTRGLNGPARQEQQQQQQQQHSQQQQPALQGPGAQDTAQSGRSELPPLNIGASSNLTSRTDQLSSIGERSREGSVMTNFTQTPITPSAGEPLTGRGDPSTAPTQGSQPVAPEPSTAAPTPSAPANGRDGPADARPVATKDFAPDSVAKAQPVQSAAPSAPSASDAPTLAAKRKDSDGMPAFDEGALYFINSMGDTLPSVSPKLHGKEVSAAPNEREVRAAGPPASISDAAQSYARPATNDAPTTATAHQPGGHATQGVDGLDSDARAAYSFLDRPPSPPVSTSSSSRAAPPTSSAAAPQAQAPPAAAPAVYPSSFNSHKSQERKMAAQAQAQAHSDALAKPGRAAGTRKSKLSTGARHAWGDDDDEEDEEEEDDEEEDPIPGAPAQAGYGSRPASGQHPQVAQHAQPQARKPPYNAYLNTTQAATGTYGSSPGGSFDSNPRSNKLVQLSRDEQPGAISTAFQPHGLLQAGEHDKAERSAKHLEADARATGGHLVNVDGKPAMPQAGLVGAISAHERERRKDGGLGATLTERERERVQVERRQREEDAMRAQMMQQQQQQQQQMMMMAGAPGTISPQPGAQPGWPSGMPPFNPMMWQQMQMMSMMNPMMFGGAAPPAGSQSGHGHGNSGGSGNLSAAELQQQQAAQAAQARAAQAAQQAYMQALQQNGAGQGSADMPASPPMSMGMMPFNPYMSMYGTPMGFPGWGAGGPGSEMGAGMMSPSPSAGAMASPPARGAGSPDPRNRQQH